MPPTERHLGLNTRGQGMEKITPSVGGPEYVVGKHLSRTEEWMQRYRPYHKTFLWNDLGKRAGIKGVISRPWKKRCGIQRSTKCRIGELRHPNPSQASANVKL